jgi:hypothetical protein
MGRWGHRGRVPAALPAADPRTRPRGHPAGPTLPGQLVGAPGRRGARRPRRERRPGRPGPRPRAHRQPTRGFGKLSAPACGAWRAA